MLKQIFISLLVLIVAAGGYIYFVPGSDGVLRSLGINYPIPTAYAVDDTASAAAPGTPAAGATGQPRAANGAGNGSGQPRAQGAPGAGGRPGGAGRAQVQTVITAPVTTSTINDRLTAIGQGSSSQSVSVTPQATGTLNKIDVKPGDQVKAGQVIAELDADAEQIAYDKANLAFKDASDALQRAQSLVKSNNATAVQLSAAQLAYDNANLELRNAKLALDKRTITTPINGTVGLFPVTAGNAVGTSAVITTIDDTSSILVNYWVPERYAPMLKTGQAVQAAAIALPGQTFNGIVSAIDSRIDPASRTLQVQAKIPNPSGIITAGMSFQVSMGFPGETYPAVDPLAIQWGADGSYVWLLAPDSKVKKDKVAIIQRNSDGVLVKGNLTPGQQVVTQGILQISDGDTVRVLDSGSGGATASAAPAATPAGAAPDAAGTAGTPSQRPSGGPSGGGSGAATPAATTPAL